MPEQYGGGAPVPVGFNVRTYGAMGNGTTDDTAAVAEAITAAGTGGTVVFPAGTYLLNTSLTPLAGQTLVGAGRQAAYLKAGTVMGSQRVVYINGVSRVQVRDLGFLGNNGGGSIVAATASIAIYTNAAPDTLIDNCYMDANGQRAVLVGPGSHRTTVSRCLMDGSTYSNTVEINASDDCMAQANTILGSTANAIELYYAPNSAPIRRTHVVDNLISGAAGSGIDVVGAIDFLVARNRIGATVGPGIGLYHGDVDPLMNINGRVLANTLVGSCTTTVAGAIYVPDVGHNGIVIADNTVDSSGKDGILSYAANAQIRGNIVFNCQLSGITVANSTATGCVVTDNICYNNSQIGVSSRNAISIGASNCVVAYNRCFDNQGSKTQDWGLSLASGVQKCQIFGNQIGDNRLGAISNAGNTNRVLGNPGTAGNPLAITAPGLPASGTPYTNAFNVDASVAITGGTVTNITIGSVATGLTSGVFRLPVGQTITLTYSVAPTWTWWGD